MDRLERAVSSLEKTVDIGRPLLRLFNEPDWPVALASIFDSICATRDKHLNGPGPSIVDDYSNITMLLAQLDWPDQDDVDEDRDDRIKKLRGLVGNVRMDIDRIVHFAGELGAAPAFSREALPAGTTMIQKDEHPGLLRGIERRLLRVEAALNSDIQLERSSERSQQQVRLIDYFVRTVQTDLTVVKASLRSGSNLDLGILERASISMIDATGRMIATVGSKFSRATTGLKNAVTQMREPVRRFAWGIRTFLRHVLSDLTTSPNLSEGDDVVEADYQGPSAGEFLRAARERLNITLEDISKESRVGLRFLEAIERSDFSVFTAGHYVLGFGKSYAQAVKEQPQAVAEMLKRDLARANFKPEKRLKQVSWASEPTQQDGFFGVVRMDVRPAISRDLPVIRDDDKRQD